MHGDDTMNQYGFLKTETITNLLNKHGFVKAGNKLLKNGVCVFSWSEQGNKARLIKTWRFLKSIEGK